MPSAQGLYDPAQERDSCGVAMVATLKRKATHEIVSQGLTALRNMEHRGATGAEPDSGDGAGILICIPDAFYREVVEFKLPEPGRYATGIIFIDKSFSDRAALEEIAKALTGFSIFGRVTPQQKRIMVTALQSTGHVVAMTGDGVNDALALKRADIGIAMDNGAPATKAVAQIVLLDGKFSHLPHVLAEGRRVIGNVERVANLFMAKNAMSLLAILVAVGAGVTFPILPRQMTLLSTLAIGLPAFFLALGPNTARYRTGFLRRIMWFAWPTGAIAGTAVVAVDVWTNDHTGSAATMTALITFFVILTAKSQPLHRWTLLLISSMAVLAASAFVIEPLKDFFNFSVTTEVVWKSVVVSLPLVAYVVARMRKDAQEVLRVELVN